MECPVLVAIDEAQNYSKRISKYKKDIYYLEKCSDLIAKICVEDRKSGISMLLMTQGVAWISRNILTNIGLWFVSKVSSTEIKILRQNLGDCDFTKYKLRTFRIFGDCCKIPFHVRALKPHELFNNN